MYNFISVFSPLKHTNPKCYRTPFGGPAFPPPSFFLLCLFFFLPRLSMCQIGPAGSGSRSSRRSEKYCELQHFPSSSSNSSSNLFFFSPPPPTETNHCGPPVVQRGALPALFGGATGEHHQWRCPHGWLFVHAWWSQRAHRGWVQFCAPGPSGPPVWVYGQRKCLAYSLPFVASATCPTTPRLWIYHRDCIVLWGDWSHAICSLESNEPSRFVS